MSYFEGPKTKLIYIYRINDSAHKGCLKIGEATYDGDDYFQQQPGSSKLNAAARKRINEQTQTAGVTYDLLYTESTVHITNKGIRSFNDKAVHDILLRSGVERKVFDRVNNANEWFICDLATAQKAIAAAKDGRESLSPGDVTHDQSPIIFRPEQREAIDKTIKQFRRGNQMLWNAKMRFGKTLSALQVVKEMQFVRTLILTHRPVVDAGWFEDFNKIFYDSPRYAYGSKNKGSSQQNLERRAAKGECNYIFFASMQDLRGSETVGGKFDKNDNIFRTAWDLIIVDEAHEGTQTQLGKAVMAELTKQSTKVLRLSGTPFNLLDDFKEDEIYTWDYVMEQRAKTEWDLTHPGDHNPYAGLPRLNIYTYDLGRLMSDYVDEDIAFNFREFFRTKESGEFIHEADVRAFLDLLTKHDEESMYPFANDRYREIFRHTLWMLPGVKAAKAMSIMLRNHPVFGAFDIVNVAGDGDEDEENSEALKMVNEAIGKNPDETRTITLSCGRLTTGVSVKPWMGVLMLSGSFNTAASAYMQTIFRVQTPFTCNGKVKEDCYVFDFAPDRTLKVLAETAKISTKAGKQGESERRQLGEFLNFCPIISVEGSKMANFDVDRMLQQLKSVYVERVVRNGFEDGSLYNDELLKLSDIDIEKFEKLKKIIGQTKAMAKSSDITVNDQGLTNEEYKEKERLDKKPKKERTPEEQARLDELKQKKEGREKAISILRGISIRMPLLIYGAFITDEDRQLTIDNFTSLVDDQSWEEFMPRGVSKQVFEEFKGYYDQDIFAAAGKRIRAMARAADNLTIEERIERITNIFATFRNPDKETVLTPWRVVNMHMGDCLGGYVFFDTDNETPLLDPRYVDHGNVTNDVFAPDTTLLEINSKSGLYPLYLAYNVYRRRLSELTTSPETLEEHQALWDKTVAENIFVICKTPMAKAVTRRTLVGFRKAKVNTRYFEDLINQIKNKPDNFISKVVRGHSFWKANNNDNMKFKAIVGNPPYQVMDGGAGVSAKPIYNLFVDVSRSLAPSYISMIMPSRWFAGGKGLDQFRESMLNDKHLSEIYDFINSKECFPSASIGGGVNYILWDKAHIGDCLITTIQAGVKDSMSRSLSQFNVFIRYNSAIHILDKCKSEQSFAALVNSRNPFGISSNVRGDKTGDLRLIASDGISYLPKAAVSFDNPLVGKYKVLMSKVTAEHAGEPDKQGMFKIISRTEIINPNDVCTDSYLIIGENEQLEIVENTYKYISTRFFRFLVMLAVSSINLSQDKFQFVPQQDFTANSDIDWSQSVADIDRQLYEKYHLIDKEIAFIESMIKPM
jgi:hypothetical protein